MLTRLLTGLGMLRGLRNRIPLLIFAAMAGSIGSRVSAQPTTELAFIINGPQYAGMACTSNQVPWNNTVWTLGRPVIGNLVVMGSNCQTGTIRAITATTPTSQLVVTCNARSGESATACSARGETNEPLSTYLGAVTPPPTVSLSATPSSIAYNGSATLSWSSTNASTCTSSGAWSGARPVSGSLVVQNLTANATYSLSCSGTGGASPLSTVTVTVAPPPAPTVTFNADPSSVALGFPTTLTWTSVGANSCIAGGGWSGSKASSGSEQIPNITADITFSITCQGAGGFSDVSTVTVTAGPPGIPPCVPSNFGGTGSPFYFRDTRLSDGSQDPNSPAGMVFYCGPAGNNTAHWIVGSPAEMLVSLATLWSTISWRPVTQQEIDFINTLIQDTRPR